MRAGVRRLGGALVLWACFAAPVLEAFDRWDELVPGGNDIEGTLFVVALCLGAAVATSLVIPLFAGPAAHHAPAPVALSVRWIEQALTPLTLNIRGSTVFRV